MTPGRRLMIFGKVPRPGHTKTRLEPALGEEGAATLYRAFLDDTVQRLRDVDAERELWLATDPGDGGRLDAPYADLRVREQAEGGLGARLRDAFATAFGEGAARAAVVGSDHPTLPPGHVEELFGGLTDADACLGPTRDGGYWAVAVRRAAWPRAAGLFVDVPWSTSRVADVTARRAEERGLTLTRASAWYDVDEPSDLGRLQRDARRASATARALEELDGSGGA